MLMIKVSYAHQVCVYLMHKKTNIVRYSKLNFQHHYSSFQCHTILQKSL